MIRSCIRYFSICFAQNPFSWTGIKYQLTCCCFRILYSQFSEFKMRLEPKVQLMCIFLWYICHWQYNLNLYTDSYVSSNARSIRINFVIIFYMDHLSSIWETTTKSKQNLPQCIFTCIFTLDILKMLSGEHSDEAFVTHLFYCWAPSQYCDVIHPCCLTLR